MLKGNVVSGVGEGHFFMSLEPYVDQMKEKLGYTPYAGTLNIKTIEQEAKNFITTKKKIIIQGFTKGTKTFGKVECYSCTIRNKECAIIVPEFTRYQLDIVELIAKDYLRDTLSLKDGDMVDIQ